MRAPKLSSLESEKLATPPIQLENNLKRNLVEANLIHIVEANSEEAKLKRVTTIISVGC